MSHLWGDTLQSSDLIYVLPTVCVRGLGFDEFISVYSVTNLEYYRLSNVFFILEDISTCYEGYNEDEDFSSFEKSNFATFAQPADKMRYLIRLIEKLSEKSSLSSLPPQIPDTPEFATFFTFVLMLYGGSEPSHVIANVLQSTRSINEPLLRAFCLNFSFEVENLLYRLLSIHSSCQADSSYSLYNATISSITFLLDMRADLLPVIIRTCLVNDTAMELALTLKMLSCEPADFSFIQEFDRINDDQTLVALLSPRFKQLQSSHSDLYFNIISRFVSVGQSLLEQRKSGMYLPDENINKAIIFLRACAAMRAYMGLEFLPDLSTTLMSLITAETAVSERAVQLIKFAICFFLAMRSLLVNDNLDGPENEPFIWLKRLVSKQLDFEAACSTSYSDLLLLLATLYHINSPSAIAETVITTLGVRFASLGRTIGLSRRMFTQQLFNEQGIVSQAINVPVTPNLTANSEGYLPIHCMIPLTQSSAFIKNNLLITRWIVTQLGECRRPVHDSMLQLLEAYIGDIIKRLQRSGAEEITAEDSVPSFAISTNTVFSFFFEMDETGEDRVNTRMYEKDMDLTPQLLMLFYLFRLYDAQLKIRADGIKRRSGREKSFLYSDTVFDLLPISFLLRNCRLRNTDYQILYPKLLLLVTNHFPHLVVGELMIQDELLLEANWQQPFASFEPKLALKEGEPEATILTKLACLERMQPHELIAYTELIGNEMLLMACNDARLARDRRFQRHFASLWRKLHLLLPRKLELMFIRALRVTRQTLVNTREKQLKFHTLNYLQLAEDPLENVVFIVDRKVFRLPMILTIFLRVLESALLGSRSMWAHKVVDRVIPPDVAEQSSKRSSSYVDAIQTDGMVHSDEECERLSLALIASQSAAVIHVLLEHCLPTTIEEALHSQITPLREVRGIICMFIHYLFIAEPCLVKIVHWQTYPRSLLAMAAEGIPSLHIVMDNLVEMFRLSASYHRMAFFFNLISHLAQHHNIRATMDRAAFMLDAIGRILGDIVTIEERRGFVLACLPAMVRLAGAFPTLIPTISQVLLKTASLFQHGATSMTDMVRKIDITNENDVDKLDCLDKIVDLKPAVQDQACCEIIMLAFDLVVNRSCALKDLYTSPEFGTLRAD